MVGCPGTSGPRLGARVHAEFRKRGKLCPQRPPHLHPVHPDDGPPERRPHLVPGSAPPHQDRHRSSVPGELEETYSAVAPGHHHHRRGRRDRGERRDPGERHCDAGVVRPGIGSAETPEHPLHQRHVTSPDRHDQLIDRGPVFGSSARRRQHRDTPQNGDYKGSGPKDVVWTFHKLMNLPK